MSRGEIVPLLACMAVACDVGPPADRQKGDSGGAQAGELHRLPPHPMGVELFDAGYVTFRLDGRKWDMDLWSCVIEEEDAGQGADGGCAGLGITDGDHVYWLQIATHQALTRFQVETVPYSDGSVAARVTADLAKRGSSTVVRRDWLVADTGQGPQIVTDPETVHP